MSYIFHSALAVCVKDVDVVQTKGPPTCGETHSYLLA